MAASLDEAFNTKSYEDRPRPPRVLKGLGLSIHEEVKCHGTEIPVSESDKCSHASSDRRCILSIAFGEVASLEI